MLYQVIHLIFHTENYLEQLVSKQVHFFKKQSSLPLVFHQDCTNRLTAFSGAIESPNYPQPYPHNISCTWIIDTTEGNAVNISFATFDLESDSNCRYDYLEASGFLVTSLSNL